MALNTAKLRRRLPEPPADGNPAMDLAPSIPTVPLGPVSSGELVLDGRSLRATGRTSQLNLKVSPEVKARFLALAQARGQLLAVLFENAIKALENLSNTK